MQTPARSPAGIFGAGPVRVTRIGQRNAEIQRRNAAVLAAARELEEAEAELAELERQARDGDARG